MRDLRSRKEDEQRLRSLQTELNQMTRINAMDEMGATVAHELNQPLTAIILYLQAVERKVSRLAGAGRVDPEDVEQLSDLCGRAIQEAQRSSSLLQRIRSIIEKKEPERTDCDLVQIIRKAHKLSLVGFAATDIYIDLITPDDDDLPLVAVDPVQIEQIFLNLLRNAFQAMREVEHKAITITLKRITDAQDRRERLLVRFQDSGPGIPESHRKNLFKAFDAERRNGMGLGLAIARSIAQSHGGSLDLAPYDEAQPGACFLLTLPIASSPSGTEKILTAVQSDHEDGNEKSSEPAQ